MKSHDITFYSGLATALGLKLKVKSTNYKIYKNEKILLETNDTDVVSKYLDRYTGSENEVIDLSHEL